MKTYITVDVGTSSMRTSCFSETGKQIFQSSKIYSPLYYNNGAARQDPEDWKKALVKTMKETAAYVSENSYEPVCISLTSQRASLVPVDKEGNPLCKAIMWQDKSVGSGCNEIREIFSDNEIYQKTGLRIDSYFTGPKIVWLKENKGEIFSKAEKFLGVQDFVFHFMTGKTSTDYSQASRTLLFNISSLDWDSDILNALGISRNILPSLSSPGEAAGAVNSGFSSISGIKEGTPVILAGGDQQVAALGLGAMIEGKAEINSGTGSFILAPAKKPVFHPEGKTLCSCSALPGYWIAEAGILTTGSLLKWFVSEFMNIENPDNDELQFPLFNSLVEKSPPGANGVITLPHFKGAAAPYWDQDAKGVFFNITLATRENDIARSIVESIGIEIGENIKLLSNIPGISIEKVIVAGGMNKSDLFSQIQSDIYNLPLLRFEKTEATSFGAFLSSIISCGVFSSYEKAYMSFAKESLYKKFIPRKRESRIYKIIAEKHNELFNSLEKSGIYKSVAELERKINNTNTEE